jgi:hypothetical protein
LAPLFGLNFLRVDLASCSAIHTTIGAVNQNLRNLNQTSQRSFSMRHVLFFHIEALSMKRETWG